MRVPFAMQTIDPFDEISPIRFLSMNSVEPRIDHCQPGCVCDSGSFFRRKSTFHVNE